MTDLATVADVLYAVPPEDFVEQRDEHVRQARADGDRALAKAVARLPKPTTAAWLLNQLVRNDPDRVRELVGLGDALREAQRSLSGPQLRQLSRQRHDLLEGFTRWALGPATDSGRSVTAALTSQVQETLGAAIADPDAGAALLSGRLTKGLAYVGLGAVDSEGGAGGSGAIRTSGAKVAGRAKTKTSDKAKISDKAEATGKDKTSDKDDQRAKERTEAARRAHAERMAAAQAAERGLEDAVGAAEADRSAAEQTLAKRSRAREALRLRSVELEEELAGVREQLAQSEDQVQSAEDERAAAEEALAAVTEQLRVAREQREQLADEAPG